MIDLHVHTRCSDGVNSPTEVIKIAKAAGIKCVAITDHDTTAGVKEAQKAGEEFGIEVIAGVEVSSFYAELPLHILGLFIDVDNEKFQKFLNEHFQARRDRIYRMVEKLNRLGVNITSDQVFVCANGAPAGRMHVSNVLVEDGVVKDVDEAFARFLRRGAPAYEGYTKSLAGEVIVAIKQAGGLSFLAHPGNVHQDTVISILKDEGLDGIEVYHCDHTPGQVAHYKNLAKNEGLLICGGSDFHGKRAGRSAKMGEVRVPDQVLDELKRVHGLLL